MSSGKEDPSETHLISHAMVDATKFGLNMEILSRCTIFIFVLVFNTVCGNINRVNFRNMYNLNLTIVSKKLTM